MAPDKRGRALMGEFDYPPPSVFIHGENTLEKLKVLNYESEFCSLKNLKPFTREYFVFPARDPELQFHSLEEIVSWLLGIISPQKTLYKIDQVSETKVATLKMSDDPNISAKKIIAALKRLSFNVDFPPSHLKQAYGEIPCMILNFLTDRAMETTKLPYQPREYVDDGDSIERAEAEKDADLGELSEIEEDSEDNKDEEEENVISEEKVDISYSTRSEQHTTTLEAKVDPVEWNKELERMAPKLQAIPPLPSLHWHVHKEQTKQFEAAISEGEFHSATSNLLNMASEISEILERVRTAERSITMKQEGLRAEYKDLRDGVSAREKEHESAKSRSIEFSNQLTCLSEEVEHLKEELTDRGSKIHESLPLVQVKHVLEQMKNEVKTFDVRIGVASHSILSTRMRLHKEMQGGLKKQVLGRDEQKDNFSDEESCDAEILQ